MMSVDEARRKIKELRGRFDAPFGSSDKRTIETLYFEVMGKTFVPTSCQACYHDAVIEIYLYLNQHNKMAEKLNYRLKAGAIINCPAFKDGKVYSNDNLTDEVAKAYLDIFPQQAALFQAIPKATKGRSKGKATKGAEPTEEASTTEEVRKTDTQGEGVEANESGAEPTEEASTTEEGA